MVVFTLLWPRTSYDCLRSWHSTADVSPINDSLGQNLPNHMAFRHAGLASDSRCDHNKVIKGGPIFRLSPDSDRGGGAPFGRVRRWSIWSGERARRALTSPPLASGGLRRCHINQKFGRAQHFVVVGSSLHQGYCKTLREGFQRGCAEPTHLSLVTLGY